MKEHKKAYSLRLTKEVGSRAETLARDNRRTVSAELGLLIEQGMEWRKKHGNTVPQPHEGQ